MKIQNTKSENKNVGAIINSQRGITLIALVITIIVLIILAGVAINLTLGENGILNKAEYAREEYKYAQAKEELELEILEVQTKIMEEQSRVATLEDLFSLIDTSKYEIVLKYEPIASSEIVQTKATYAEVVEIESNIGFIVDNRLKIKEVSIKDDEEEKEITIKSADMKIGTSYVKIVVDAETKTEQELTYKYMLDGAEVASTNENEYIIEELDPESTHVIKVIVQDEDGNQNEVQRTIKTEARVYLYNNGEEYTDITGGWETAISTYSGTGEKKDSHLYCYSPIHNKVFSTYYFKTVNKINLEEYKKICFEVSVTVHSNGTGDHWCRLGGWTGGSYSYWNGSMIVEPAVSLGAAIKTTGSNQKVSIDISEGTEEMYIISGITSGGANDSIGAEIYEVWLEK